ncbi:MAG: hypothetical protein D6708_11940 [Candidatus Dadabacteria bacterium]|nr:MAG: hypothetical protein D6708_11940 [Candidatus Dadabacteria bacterium]
MAQGRTPGWLEHARVIVAEWGFVGRPTPLFLYPEEGGGRPREVVAYVDWVQGDLDECALDEADNLDC